MMTARFGFFHAGLDALQRSDAFALQITFARARQNRFRHETMLHPKTLFDGFLQEIIFNRSHVLNLIINPCFRKLKNPPRRNLIIALPRFRA
jgi:hypothetical protein